MRSSARRDPCGGPPARAVPTATLKNCHALTEVPQQIPRLLSNPDTVRVCGDSEKVHAPGGVLHEEQDV